GVGAPQAGQQPGMHRRRAGRVCPRHLAAEAAGCGGCADGAGCGTGAVVTQVACGAEKGVVVGSFPSPPTPLPQGERGACSGPLVQAKSERAVSTEWLPLPSPGRGGAS